MAGQRETTEADSSLERILPKLEVDRVGVASLADWKETKLEETAFALLPEAKSAVVFSIEVIREVLDLSSPTRIQGAASTTDLINTDSAHISGRLTWAAYDFSRAMRDDGYSTLPLPAEDCPTDNRFLEAVFSYKHAAQAAGMGKLGWHSLLITPEFGPRTRLCVCLTAAELETSAESMVTFNCERCRKCIDICPAGAIKEPSSGEPYRIDKFACNAYRTAAGGCSECMRVCPPGMKSRKKNG
jgi:epoxyqueuosine reductase